MTRAIAYVLAGVLLGVGVALAEEAGKKDPAPPDAKRAGKDYSPYPNPDAGYVTDLAGLLTGDEEERLERWLWQVESRTKVEVIVVTIDSIGDYPGTANGSIEAFARGLFDKYGIGNKPKNDGVLLLVARGDRKARIELGAGYGRARDADSRRIMNKVILPRFKKDEYAEGITDGVKALMLEFAGVRVGTNWKLIITVAAIPVCGLVAFSLFRSGKKGWGWIFVGVIFILVLALIRMVVGIMKHAPRGSSSSWSSGGLGGFGGGFSGGGGATGSW